jgi:hypothetical protein
MRHIFFTILSTCPTVGCATATTTSPAVTADSACAALVKARCARRDACTSDLGNKVRTGDIATCTARDLPDCIASLKAPSTSRTAADVQACATAITSVPCSDWFLSINPAVCNPKPGKIADGQACSYSAQCVSAWCSVAKTAIVGTCGSQPKAGDACETFPCGPGLLCNKNAAGAQVCMTPVAENGACDKDHRCAPEWSCVGIKGAVVQGACKKAVTTVDAACDHTLVTGVGCDNNLYLFCGSDDKCHADTLATAGQGCGKTGTDAIGTCLVSECIRKAPTDPAGTCTPYAADGAACDSDATKGPGCEAPARCVPTISGGTAGTCKRFG